MTQVQFNDATNLSFALQQASYVEPVAVLRKYPDITYMDDVPVDTSANPYAATVTFFSLDRVGTAKLITAHSDDVPLANIALDKWEAPVYTGGAGYAFSKVEIGQAMMAGGMNLSAMGAEAAVWTMQKFIDAATYLGTGMPAGVTGLYNTAGVTTLAATGLWSALTGDQILADANAMLSGVYSGSLMVEMADTLRLPPAVYANIATKARGATTDTTVLQFLQAANVYTASTGKPLNIRGDKFLTTTACAYRKDPDVIKLHLPMPPTFEPMEARSLSYYVAGMFRMAALDVRRPGSIRYMSGVA